MFSRLISLTLFALFMVALVGAQTRPAPTAPDSTAGTVERDKTPSNATDVYWPAPQGQASQPSHTAPQNAPAGTWGQRTQAPAYPSGIQIPAGITIRATLDTPLSTKTSQVGDRFTATVAEPVRDNRGQVAIPVGTKINGQVSNSEQGKAVAILRGKGRLDLRFIDMTLPSGQSAPLVASLRSVTGTSGNTQTADSEGGIQSGTSGKTAAKDVGIGAGIGTVAGLIFGSALKGLAIGAIAGGGYVLATKGKDVDLPANTGLLLVLDQPLTVPANSGGR